MGSITFSSASSPEDVNGNTFYLIGFGIIVLIAVTFNFLICLFKIRRENDISVKKRKGAIVGSLICVQVIFTALTLLRFGPGIESLKGILLLGILSFAAVSDLMTHTADNYLSIMILIVGLIGFDPKTVLQKLFACAAIFGLFLIVTLILKKSPGGADIKLSAAVSFVTGLSRSLVTLMIGMTLAVVTMTVLSKLKKYDREKPFPLLPFISVGAMIGYLI